MRGIHYETEYWRNNKEIAKGKRDHARRICRGARSVLSICFALTELYNGMNADIDAELTADLVGDYFFTDKDFINKLTGNRTLFQKVWDEVKYLCKVATGKELTEIEKVEREFAKAWKEQGQIAQSEESGDVKYSVSNSALDNGTDLGYNGNDLYTATDEFLVDVPAGDRNHFARSLANKTSDLGKNEIRTVEIYGADKVYYFEATGYMQGHMLYSADVGDLDEYRTVKKEYYDGYNSSRHTFSSWSSVLSSNGTGTGGDIHSIENGRTESDVYEVYGESRTRNSTGTQERIRQDFEDDPEEVKRVIAELRKMYGLTEDQSTNEIAPINETSSTDGVFFDGEKKQFSIGDDVKYRGNSYVIFGPEQAKDVENQNPTDNPDIRYSISKDIENFDNSWYNEIELPFAEKERVQSEALTWNANKRNQLITQTLSNGITYQYEIDDEGIVHIYGKEKSANIHDWKDDYGNTDTTRSDSITEELWLGYGNNGVDVGYSQDGRKPSKNDTNDNRFVSGKGRSNRTGYSEDRANAYGKPKKRSWHFNEDGSYEVTYSDGTKVEVSSTDDAFFDGKISKHSLSNEGEQFAPVGNYSTPLNETALDIAPVAEGVAKTETVAENATIEQTVDKKISAKLQNLQTELENNKKLRDESNADFDSEISRLQAEYDAKKDKNTKVANNILRRIERIQRLKANVIADYDSRINSLGERVKKMQTPQYRRGQQRKAKQEQFANEIRNLIGDTSTWRDKKLGISYQANTLHRNLRDVVRDANGDRDIAKADEIYEYLQGSYNHNEAQLKRESRDIKQSNCC